MNRRPIFLGILCAGLLPLTAVAQGLPNASPFGSSDATATAAPAKPPQEAYEFVGMTVVGKDTLLSITRVSDRHSTWVPLGKTVAEITAVSYDPRSDIAVIKAESQVLTLTLRKAVIAAGPINQPSVFPSSAPAVMPAPASPPVAATPAGPPIALTDQEKANEARMMVSDLLEIGQQQRLAYAEAQRQAAARAAASRGNSPAPAQPGAPTPR